MTKQQELGAIALFLGIVGLLGHFPLGIYIATLIGAYVNMRGTDL